jgi:hypothetical protein
MSIEDARRRLSDLLIEQSRLKGEIDSTHARWLSITNLGHSLRAHEIEHQNRVAVEYHILIHEYASVVMEINSLVLLLS